MSMISLGGIMILTFCGVIYKKFNARAATLIFGLIAASGFFLLAYSKSLTMCYLAALLVGIGHSGGGLVPMSILMTRWFSAGRGMAIGLCTMGSGLGSMIFSPVTTYWIANFGLRRALMLHGGSITALVLLAFSLIRSSPEKAGLTPYGYAHDMHSGADNAIEDIAFPIAVKTGRFYGIIITTFFIGLMVSPINNHIPSFLISIGHTPMFAAKVFSVFGAAMIGGKLLTGFIIDRVGMRKANWYMFLVWGAALLSAFYIGHDKAAAYIFAVLIGLGNPIATIPLALWVTELFGRKDYAIIYSVLSIVAAIGIGIGYSVNGLMADITGSYLTIYGIYFVIDVIALAAIQITYGFMKRRAP